MKNAPKNARRPAARNAVKMVTLPAATLAKVHVALGEGYRLHKALESDPQEHGE